MHIANIIVSTIMLSVLSIMTIDYLIRIIIDFIEKIRRDFK